ncbi:MAG: hypothetical protein ABIG84_06820 [archaeon]
MKKSLILGMAALLVFGLIAVDAFAFGGHFRGNAAAAEALEANDYQAYLTALDESYQAYRAGVTEEKFNTMAGRHQQMSEKRALMEENRAAVQAAIESGDYEAWLLAIEGNPGAEKLKEVITQDNFATFVELHQAIEDKDFKTAKAISEELGIDGPNNGFGRGMNRHARGGCRMLSGR